LYQNEIDMLKKIMLVLGAILVLIQFIRPERNTSNDLTYDVHKKYPGPYYVQGILGKACNDCHSNKTEYPWYANVQPVAWMLANHVNDGKRHLNFSNFTSMRIAIQNHKFEEVIEVLDEGEMPLPSYTWLGRHPEAKLTSEEKTALIDWARMSMDSIKAQYPADSLVMPKRPGPPPGK